MKIRFGSISAHLGSRFAAAAVREKVISAINRNEEVIFDFTGVETLSGTFADECFARLIENFSFEKIKGKTVYENASPFVKIAISNAFKHRLSQAVYA